MGVIIDMSERGGDVRRFDEAINRAKSGIHEACEIWENMKAEFSERNGGHGIGSYSERYNNRGIGFDGKGGGGNYHYRDNGMPTTPMMSERDWRELQERRMRDGMGRFM